MFDSIIYQDIFGTAQMRQLFSDKTLVNLWLKVLIRLAETQAELGVIPQDAAEEIAKEWRLNKVPIWAAAGSTRAAVSVLKVEP